MTAGAGFRRVGNLSLLAFVGVAFSKQQDQDNLFSKIRECVDVVDRKENVGEERYSMDTLQLGEHIATGCNATVYAAKLTGINNKAEFQSETVTVIDEDASDVQEENQPLMEVNDEDNQSDIIIIDEDNHSDISMSDEETESDVIILEEETESVINIRDEETESDIIILDEETELDIIILDEEAVSDFIVLQEETDSDISILDEDSQASDVSSLDADTTASDISMSTSCDSSSLDEDQGLDVSQSGLEKDKQYDYDLAVKMMFNFDVESNAEALTRAMYKETLPLCLNLQQPNIWHNGNHVRKKPAWLPQPHPNIVSMYAVFVDSVVDLKDSRLHYPAALPPKLYEDGLGRNATMFLVMKRYTCTLREYLEKNQPDVRVRCSLLCQLLEGLTYLQSRGVAHRDIKTDNLLINVEEDSDTPQLVISDFGCCLCEGSLKVPFHTSETCRGGNAALMAPEILCVEPGPHAVLDYTKSDLWATGTLIYEIFGMENPFYRSKTKPRRLDSRTYTEQELPPLPEGTPRLIQTLTQNMLSRNPSKRVNVSTAATVAQLCLSTVTRGERIWNDVTAMTLQNMMVQLTAEVVICGRRDTSVESTLKTTLLSRLSRTLLNDTVFFLKTVH